MQIINILLLVADGVIFTVAPLDAVTKVVDVVYLADVSVAVTT